MTIVMSEYSMEQIYGDFEFFSKREETELNEPGADRLKIVKNDQEIVAEDLLKFAIDYTAPFALESFH